MAHMDDTTDNQETQTFTTAEVIKLLKDAYSEAFHLGYEAGHQDGIKLSNEQWTKRLKNLLDSMPNP